MALKMRKRTERKKKTEKEILRHLLFGLFSTETKIRWMNKEYKNKFPLFIDWPHQDYWVALGETAGETDVR